MVEFFQCPKCSKEFTSSEVISFGKCPDCKKLLRYIDGPQTVAHGATQINPGQTSSDLPLAILIEAQNRTTFAVRSLALFFFISLQSSILGGALIGLAINNKSNYDSYGQLSDGATAFVGLGCLIVVVGFLIAALVGGSELNKSKVRR
jgi:hypothetical protein